MLYFLSGILGDIIAFSTLGVLILNGFYLYYLYNKNKCTQRLIALIFYVFSIVTGSQDNSCVAASFIAAIGLSLLISFTAKEDKLNKEDDVVEDNSTKKEIDETK